MKMTESIINDFEALSVDKLRELSNADIVELKDNGHSRKGRVTRPPYFEVAHILTMTDDPRYASGAWWIDIDGDKKSLRDSNAVPNNYNDHSISVISNRQ